jgi:hypothetical protein
MQVTRYTEALAIRRLPCFCSGAEKLDMGGSFSQDVNYEYQGPNHQCRCFGEPICSSDPRELHGVFWTVEVAA